MSRKSQRNRPQPVPGAPQTESSSAGRRFSGLAVVIGSAALILAAFALGAFLFTNKGSQSGPGPDTSAASAASALASLHSPTLGDADAKVHIVEFLDPACETCAQFFPIVKQLMAENPGRIRLSVRHVPFHTGSDQVVRILEASRQQDKYWQTLEALLASQATWAPQHTARPDLALQAISGVGLDMERLQSDMNAPDVAQRMQQDMNDAMAVKVTATPEYFVNGRPLPSFGVQQLLSLVREELQAAY